MPSRTYDWNHCYSLEHFVFGQSRKRSEIWLRIVQYGSYISLISYPLSILWYLNFLFTLLYFLCGVKLEINKTLFEIQIHFDIKKIYNWLQSAVLFRHYFNSKLNACIFSKIYILHAGKQTRPKRQHMGSSSDFNVGTQVWYYKVTLLNVQEAQFVGPSFTVYGNR